MFDFTNAQDEGFGTIPAGKYAMITDDAELKDTKSGNGQYIKVKCRILEGDYSGRFVWLMFNIKNENQKAQNIGNAQMKSLLKALGFTELKFTQPTDLVGYKFIGQVSVKSDEAYGDKNEVKKFEPYAAEKKTNAPF